jgi:hypothetical protein
VQERALRGARRSERGVGESEFLHDAVADLEHDGRGLLACQIPIVEADPERRLECQARLAGGQNKLARIRLQESAAIAATCDATTAWHHDSLSGDISFQDGDLAEALRCFARSLQSAEARGDAQQIAFDLIAAAGTLARLGQDESAAEVVGILDAHCSDAGGTRQQMLPIGTGLDEALAALDRLGEAAGVAQRRGTAVSPGQRVARAVAVATRTVGRIALT